MKILGIESSCDETAFAVVESNGRVLSNSIASQIELHARFGGVVPEIASRAHLEATVPLFRDALDKASCTMQDIDAIAATQGPGLSGCLLVGLEFAKALALRHNKPLVPVHHIAGHADSVQLGTETNAWGEPIEGDEPQQFVPYLALVVSGGHSSLIAVRENLKYEILGQTLDDAVGEAYDKLAKLLGLGYPGGPLMDKLAQKGNPKAFKLPRPLSKEDNFNFSFSGLKTAVAREVTKYRDASGEQTLPENFIIDLAASFQEAAVDSLAIKVKKALKQTGVKRLAVTGGVACNSGLRAHFKKTFTHTPIAFPAPEYCTDNAAMIAGLGARLFHAGRLSGLELNAKPSWRVDGF